MKEQVLEIKEKTELINVNRLEVIDDDGRSYTNYLNERQSIYMALQDGGRTLKIFVENAK